MVDEAEVRLESAIYIDQSRRSPKWRLEVLAGTANRISACNDPVENVGGFPMKREVLCRFTGISMSGGSVGDYIDGIFLTYDPEIAQREQERLAD
jgi:hypothetical protein